MVQSLKITKKIEKDQKRADDESAASWLNLEWDSFVSICWFVFWWCLWSWWIIVTIYSTCSFPTIPKLGLLCLMPWPEMTLDQQVRVFRHFPAWKCSIVIMSSRYEGRVAETRLHLVLLMSPLSVDKHRKIWTGTWVHRYVTLKGPDSLFLIYMSKCRLRDKNIASCATCYF